MPDNDIVNIAVEGDLDEVVLTRLLASVGLEVHRVYGKRGKANLEENVPRYNAAALHENWVLLVDLDNDYECAPQLVETWVPHRNPGLQLRVAVHAIEAWLLADRTAISRFLGVSQTLVAAQPENEPRPKRTLIDLARRSRRRTIREDVVPPEGSVRSEGPGYTTRLTEFAERHWDLRQAATRAPSLGRALNSLANWSKSHA